MLVRLWRIFCGLEARTLEVNPLALTADGEVVAPSGVILLDDQAAFRHPEIESIVDPGLTNGWRPLTPLERRMREIDATDAGSSIRFNEFEDGDIAFMVTGGGAGLLAVDAVLRCGGRPATTLDITPGRVEQLGGADPVIRVDLTSDQLPSPRLRARGGAVAVPAYTDLRVHDITRGPGNPTASPWTGTPPAPMASPPAIAGS